MKSKDTILIADDEKLARNSIRLLLNQRSTWTILGEATDGREAIHMINKLTPDLVFLDIDMPVINGIDLVGRLVHKPHIVFTTAYDTFAIKAFEENAIDYLLKPYTDKRFFEALSRVELKIREHQSAEKLDSILTLLQKQHTPPAKERKLSVRSHDKIVIVDLNDLLWVNASGNYVELHTSDQKYLHYDTMNSMEGLLSESGFTRIHRSHIVRNDQIASLRREHNGEYYIELHSGVELKLSRSNVAKVKNLIAQSTS